MRFTEAGWKRSMKRSTRSYTPSLSTQTVLKLSVNWSRRMGPATRLPLPLVDCPHRISGAVMMRVQVCPGSVLGPGTTAATRVCEERIT